MKPPRNKTLNPRLPANASIKVIGLGGVGSIVARYGAVFLASMGTRARLVLVDGDFFEPTNSSRMLFGECGNKAEVVRSELYPRFKNTSLALEAVDQFVTPWNRKKLIRSGDIVLMCVDRHKVRRLVSRHCEKLRNICLISGGNDGIGKDSTGRVRRGTYGNVQIYWRKNGREMTVPLTKFHPEIEHPKDKLPGEENCTELIASVPQILFSNLAAASGILNALLLHLSEATHYAELCFDIADGLMRPTIGMKHENH